VGVGLDFDGEAIVRGAGDERAAMNAITIHLDTISPRVADECSSAAPIDDGTRSFATLFVGERNLWPLAA